MAWVEATGVWKGKEIKVEVELWSSRRNVYKKVRYYLDGERVTRAKKEIKELVKDAPEILFANTYFWTPFWGNAGERERYAEKLLKPLAEFFKRKGFEVITSWNEEKEE